MAECSIRTMSVDEADGALAGCVSAVSYDGRFGFVGLYIVAPQWRGHGIGWRLWMPNADAVALAERYGMRSVFETARMYTAAAPACALERVFGMTSFELG